MVYYLMIQELYWSSATSRANAQPITTEIQPQNLDEGIVMWFKWNTTNGTLEYLSEGDRDWKCKFPFNDGSFYKPCTTTLLYCERDGFSSIPYHPFRDNACNNEWAHWWSLGFNTRDRDIFTIGRDDEFTPGHDGESTSERNKAIPANRSEWFQLFRDTKHDNSPAVNDDAPILTGATSLIWALAAFQFDAGTLGQGLPGALVRDGKLHVRWNEQDCPPGRKSQRALAVELWVHKGDQATVKVPPLC